MADRLEMDAAAPPTLEAVVVACAKVVRAALGSGLTEAIYQAGLCLELRARGHAVASEIPVPVMFRDQIIGVLRADVLVDGLVIAELKTTARLTDAHAAQLAAYTRRVPGVCGGVLLNFAGSGDDVEVRALRPCDVAVTSGRVT